MFTMRIVRPSEPINISNHPVNLDKVFRYSILIILRKASKDVTISIVTAKGTPDRERMKGLESYVCDYIAKPFDIQQLISNVRSMYAS